MIRQTDEKVAELLLPLAGGLVIVGTNSTVSLGGSGLLALLVLLALGAVLPEHPWRTGAIAAGPMVVAAARRVEEIRRALQGHTAESLRRAAIGSGLSGLGVVPGGPYRSTRPGTDRFTATAEIRKLSQFRCIHVEVDAGGALATKVFRGDCS